MQIFQSKTYSESPLLNSISKIVGYEVTEDSAHSQLICKKCFKLIDEADELQSRLSEIKSELVGNYTTSVTKHKSGDENDESVDEVAVATKVEANKENELPRKILDIPSSDDDNSQVCFLDT